MKRIKQNLKYIVLICLLSVSTTSFAQEGLHKVGLTIGLDHMVKVDEVSPKIGFSYQWMPTWWGIETGVSWRTNGKSFPFDMGSNTYLARINTHYLSIPLLWRVNLSPVNVSLGPELDYYLGYSVSESKTTAGLSVDGYDETRINIGGTLKVGFPITLSENWIVEPEVRASISVIDFFVGLGIAIKFGR